MSQAKQKPEELGRVSYRPPRQPWMDPHVEFRKGTYNHAAVPDSYKYLDLPNPRKWQMTEEDWKLPENWKQILFEGMRERLNRFRSFKIFMDICVRCGACADKCHFFLGSGDPKNMPVLRAELLRSVYRREFTRAGKIMGKMIGARELTIPVLKEWFLRHGPIEPSGYTVAILFPQRYGEVSRFQVGIKVSNKKVV